MSGQCGLCTFSNWQKVIMPIESAFVCQTMLHGKQSACYDYTVLDAVESTNDRIRTIRYNNTYIDANDRLTIMS